MVENVFGIMSSVFRVLRKPMLLQPDKASLVTMICVASHNFLRRNKVASSIYTPPGTFDFEDEGGNLISGSWRKDQGDVTSFLPIRKIGRKTANDAKEIREEFAEYFKTTGRVSWQDKYA